MGEDNRTYWGRLPEYSEEFGREVMRLWEEHQRAIMDSGLARRVDRSVLQYHSRDEWGNDTSMVSYDGDKGELVTAQVNEYRVLVRTKKSLALADPLRFRAVALNDDSEALRAQRAAQGILRHYDATGMFTKARDDLAETSLVMAAGWVGASWNRSAGELEDLIPQEEVELAEAAGDEETEDDLDEVSEHDEDEGGQEDAGPIARFSGDPDIDVYNLFQVAYDRNSKDVTNPNWVIVRPRVNRHDLAAELPLEREEIMSCSHEYDHPWEGAARYFEQEDPDYIWPFYVYFKPRPTTPRGRMSIVLPGGKVIKDLPSKLSRVPVFMLPSSMSLIGPRLPYGDEFDALLPCELTQDAYSGLSTQTEARTPIIVVPEEVTPAQIGMFKVLKNPSDRQVQTLDLFKPDDSLYRNIGTWQNAAARVAQINPAMMGTPSQYESGSSQVYQVSQGMVQQRQFTNALAYVMSQLASMFIELLRLHMEDGRLLRIVGIHGQGQILQFKRSQMELIQNVTVVQSEPGRDTPEAREAFADKAAEKGWARNKDEWVAAYVSGATGLLTADETGRAAMIRSENEQILSAVRDLPEDVHAQANAMIREAGGKDVGDQVAELLRDHIDPSMLPQVCVGDDHREHWSFHSDLENNEAVRRDPLAKHLLQAHNNQHVLHLTPGSAFFNYHALLISGQKPLADANTRTGRPNVPQDGQPPAAEGFEKPQGSAPKPPSNNPGAAQAGLPPRLPSAPTNPSNGAPAPAQALESAPMPSGSRG